jgi:hypothetical protein
MAKGRRQQTHYLVGVRRLDMRRCTRKNWSGPAIAAAAHGTTLSLNWRRKRNGKSEKIARKTRYQTSGRTGSAGLKRLKCQVDSSAATQRSPTAGIQSIE